MKTCIWKLSLAVLAFAAGAAWAEYPVRPLRIVVPLPPGGASDAVARTVAQSVSASLGQPVLIENKPGAGGAIGAKTVMAAPADGYTLLWGISSMVALPLLQKSPPYGSLGDLTPVSIVGRLSFGVVVHSSVPAKTIAELVAFARSNPEKLSYGSATYSEYLAAAQFMKAAGVRMLRVPYKGGSQMMPDLVQGRVQVNFGPVSSAYPHVRAGRLNMLAMLQPQRSRALPNVPTMSESGMSAVSVPSWQAIFGPTGMSPAIAKRLSGEIRRALESPAVREKVSSLWIEPEGSAPETLAETVASDFVRWQAFVRDNGIQPE